MGLELYARAEHLLGIEASTEALHTLYADLLSHYPVTTLLDIGCGRGALMQHLASRGFTCKGIDLSPTMVAAAKAQGLDAECRELAAMREHFDAAVAVFDVLNFLPAAALGAFMASVADVLNPGGIFIADINTLHGFVNVAQGVMVAEDASLFVSVDAVFESPLLLSTFTLFEKSAPECYKRSQETIIQTFHPLSAFKKLPSLKLIEQRPLSLYDKNDKMVLIFKKVI